MYQNKFILDKEKCSLCQVCVLTCPCSALEFVEMKNGTEIAINRSLCKYPCQVCQDKCPTQAIKLEKKLFFTYLPHGIDRWFIHFDICEECGHLMESSIKNNTCPKCRRKQVALQQATIYPCSSVFRK
ncbi:hypothetical protein M7775_23455 [Sporomusa sphaeroides DSM 2875]|uniref:hypothetical protein n=1 Tax=Sporomusa sphaeroides TaxID=47679 RepID=UPI0020305246|nr:hypothetical protein [Sporomusa sphaeroides]MCM0761512.1 hypothetical protein [Sporomusa sphaeroides DSM 2875]